MSRKQATKARAAGNRAACVLFVTHSAAPAGAELKMLDWAECMPTAKVLFLTDGPLVPRFRAAGIDTEVWSLPETITQVRTDTRSVASIGATADAIRLAWRLARAIRHSDVVVAVSQKALVLCALALPLARRPLVWTLNDIVTASHFSPAMRALGVRLGNMAATRVVCNSQATAAAFVGAGGVQKITVIVPPVSDSVDYLRAAPILRKTLEIPCDAYLVGLFGRLSEWKGQHVLLDALKRLPEDTHALIVGGALFGEESYAERLRAIVTQQGLSRRVHFLGHREDVPSLMASCDAIVHASTAPEPFGRVVVEGMLTGRPVVATDAGGVPEIITDGITGRLVPPADPTALAEVLTALRDDPAAAAQLAAAGRAHALRNFSAEASTARLRATLEAVQPLPVPLAPEVGVAEAV